MNRWKETKLGDVALMVNGFAFRGSDFIENGIPVIKIKNVKPNNILLDNLSYVSDEVAAGKENYLIKPNDILITMSGNRSDGSPDSWVGKCSLFRLNGRYLLNQRVSIIRVNEAIASTAFIAYNLSSWKTQLYLINQSNSSGGQANISPGLVMDIDIFLPPLPEQTAIAEVLSSLDDKIDLLHRQNKTLEQLAETLFRQWFVEEAVESWEVGTLGDVISIYDSKRIPVSSGEREKMKIGQLFPYYGAATIMDYVNDYIFDGEYILMGEDGTVQTPDGYPILQLPTGKFWVNNHAHIFQAKTPYTNFFIYIFLKLTNISGIVTGAVQPKINQEALKGIDFLVPPIEKTHRFINETNVFWNKIKSNTQQILTLKQLRDTLLPKLMSGEVRVKNAK